MILLKRNTRLLALYAGLSLAFTVLGMMLMTDPGQLGFTEHAGPVKIWGMMAVLFSGICLAILFYVLFIKKISLRINGQGITDHSSIAGVGLIRWEDIRSVQEVSIQSRSFLYIAVHDPEPYLAAAGNRPVKIILEHNIRAFGTPILISASLLECTFGELKKAILDGYALHGNGKTISD